MRILALDWGSVRIGGAVSDPDGIMAFPLEKYIDGKDPIPEIQKILLDENVEKILLGMPMSLAGEETDSSKSVREFADELESKIGCPIVYFDERFSSMGASKNLSEQGISQKDQRKQVDNLAAQSMLQTYLDTKSERL